MGESKSPLSVNKIKVPGTELRPQIYPHIDARLCLHWASDLLFWPEVSYAGDHRDKMNLNEHWDFWAQVRCPKEAQSPMVV